MKFHATIVAASIMPLLAGCGGGGENTDVHRQQTASPNPAPFESVAVSIRSETGNPTAAEVIAYLRSHASGGPWNAGPDYSWSYIPGVARFAEPPTVRVAEGTDPHYRAMTLYAVGLINRVLPYDYHIQIGDDAPPLTPIDEIPDGQIFVDFGPSETWRMGGRPGASATAQNDIVAEWDEEQQRWEQRGLRAARVWMDWNSPELRQDDMEKASVLVHELVHTLGLGGHVPISEFPDSNMRDLYLLFLDSGVPSIDGTAIRALYTRLGKATDPEDLSVDDLGPWEETYTNVVGEFLASPGEPSSEYFAFGVRHRNGVSVPWTTGSWPDTALADNAALNGTATWEGGILGFMPDARLVGGNAQINVHLATLDGEARFHDLQLLPAGQGANAFGNGVQWNSGRLDYAIAVHGNVIHNTGGDDGILAGRFHGNEHKGVAGTLERTDLTAAFGAERQ